MKKLIVLTTSLVILIVFVVPFIAGLLIKMIPGADQPAFDFNNKRGLYGDLRVSQEFTSTDANLTAIGTSLGNPNLKNKKEIVFDLMDISGNLVREVKVNGANVPDGAFFRFVFDPVQDSKGVRYFFTISTPSAGPEELINVFFAEQKTDWIGSGRYNKEINDNGLPIVTYFKPKSRMEVAKEIYLSWLGRVF